ncbi:MAG: cytochrome C [Polyangiaceae bacterium]|nr:cytochrome C [Polyangiaceae bacterium]
MSLRSSLVVLCVVATGAGCSSEATTDDGADLGTSEGALSWGTFPADGPTTVDTPIGIALDIENGVGVPLKVRKGQRVYINQMDMRAAIDASSDNGVADLDTTGDFKDVDWRGTSFADQSFVGTPNADGTWVKRRFYRKARWMDQPSAFVIEQLDAAGNPSGLPLIPDTGLEYKRFPTDSFFVRRMRAIQWTYDCAAPPSNAAPNGNCAGATKFGEEALIELRYAAGPQPSVKLGPRTTQLRVRWTAKWNNPYTIPVQQVENPNFDYGFGLDVTPVTAPAANGTYSAGQAITFRVTLKDGSGTRLHPVGVMPSYQDYLAGLESGITYYRFFQEPYATYYRRKHKEHHLLVAVSGPVQDVKPIYNITDLNADLDPVTGQVNSAQPVRDGFYGAAQEVPPFATLFGGPPAWGVPGVDTVTFNVPATAKPGTYRVVIKGRREFLGQEVPTSKVINIQIGTTQVGQPALNTGPCNSCHTGGSALSRVNHGLDDRSTCSTCHAPLSFELEGPIAVRLHFIHSRSNRFDKPLDECKSCHLNKEGIQRTSKAACLSCHKSYPASHVAQFGPITDMYVGGGTESFQNCTSSCHTNHPNSGISH